MPVSRFTLDSPLRQIAGVGATLVLLVGAVLVLIWAFAHTLARNADAIQASEFAASISPSDPLVRYRYAAGLDQTFDLESITRSLGEYEAAVAAAPHNFTYWIGLGQARERDGDRARAELAYRRALELAPSYGRTRWALGNNVIRQGKLDEGVGLIKLAVDQDSAFAAPAVTATMLAFADDIERVLGVLGSNQAAVAELAKYLVNSGRFDEGVTVWKSQNPDLSTSAVREAGLVVRGKLIESKRFRDAVQISAALEADDGKRPTIGSITNGGFERGVATQNADYFDWQIGHAYPIFGLSDTQPKEGRYSLIVRFTTPSRLDFATVSRTIAVEPGATYDLSVGYRSDLTTRAEFRWEVISASNRNRLSGSEAIIHQSGWGELRMRVSVPRDTDGVTLRLVREKCDSAACTVSGNIWFDDIRMVRAE